MFDPVIASLNSHLAAEEAYEALMDECQDEREALEAVQARIKEICDMDDALWNDDFDAEISRLYDREEELQKQIAGILSGDF